MKVLVFLFFIKPVISLGQSISENFENNDLTQWYQNSPNRWEISKDCAIEGSYSLNHTFDNDQADIDWIALFHRPLQLNAAQTTWQFSIRYKNKPSANNNWAVMLSCSNMPGEDKLMDFALVLGVNYRGSDDEIHLWKQQGENIENIVTTGFNWEDNIEQNTPVSFRITRTAWGFITVEIDTMDENFFTIGQASEPQIAESGLFVLYYKYSSSCDRGLCFDNLKIEGKFSNDLTVPLVNFVHILSSRRLIVEFNEIVRLIEKCNFCVEGAGCVSSDNFLGKYFELILPFDLTPGHKYYLQIPEISDMYGNKISAGMQIKDFYYPAVYDVVINEILADPLPPVLLPQAEFVEIVNTTREEISLYDWKLFVNDKKSVIPQKIIGAGEYLILCNEDSINDFKDYKDKVVGLVNFHSLRNDGAEIILSEPTGRLIHTVNYNDNWYESDEKRGGGWSLEMIDPLNPCNTSGNWKESVDYRGGTPGEVNSVYSGNLLNTSPKLLRAAIADSGALVLYFSEPMDSTTIASPDFYFIDHDIGAPFRCQPKWPVADNVELLFNNGFEKGIEYEVTITSDLCDCAGKPINGSQSVRFQVPELADSNDIVINEIMFDPQQNYDEYIELYNHSNKTIDIKDYQLMVGYNGEAKVIITNEYYPLPPETYIVLSREYSGIDNENEFEHLERVVKMPDMHVLPNDGSAIYFFNAEGKTIDIVNYSPSYHHRLITESKGVSLERISPDVSGLEPNNWQSASFDVGYKTPATKNSQSEFKKNKNGLVIIPETIILDADGLGDELSICYQMDDPGYMARIIVFDIQGNSRFILANGSLLGTEGCYYFEGKDEAGEVLQTGYYVILFDAYNLSGKRFKDKKVFVVARDE
jgi:hypothetical protein